MSRKLDISLYESIIKYDENARVNKSASWISAKLPELLSGRQTKILYVGKMYMFAYDPVGKEHLPYWDRFPLIIVLKNKGKYIEGINLHYVPVKLRINIFRKILNNCNTKTLKPTSKIITPLAIVQSIPNSEYMIKRYVPEGVVSNIIEIPGEEWGHAIALPIAEWKTGNKESTKMGNIQKTSLSHNLANSKQMKRDAQKELK